MENGKEIVEIIKRYGEMGLSSKEISQKIGIDIKQIRRVLGEPEKAYKSVRDDTRIQEIDNKARKSLEHLDKLSSGELVKGEYASDWLKGAGEIVKIYLGKQMLLEHAKSRAHSNIYEELVELMEWEKNELRDIREAYGSGLAGINNIQERIRTVRMITQESLKSMGIKSDKNLSEIIEKVGALNISEERLMLEKTKFVKEDENIQKTRNLLEKLTDDLD